MVGDSFNGVAGWLVAGLGGLLLRYHHLHHLSCLAIHTELCQVETCGQGGVEAVFTGLDTRLENGLSVYLMDTEQSFRSHPDHGNLSGGRVGRDSGGILFW